MGYWIKSGNTWALSQKMILITWNFYISNNCVFKSSIFIILIIFMSDELQNIIAGLISMSQIWRHITNGLSQCHKLDVLPWMSKFNVTNMTSYNKMVYLNVTNLTSHHGWLSSMSQIWCHITNGLSLCHKPDVSSWMAQLYVTNVI